MYMKLSDKEIQKTKNVLEKQHGREITWTEATQATALLHQFAELAIDMAKEEKRKQELLEKHPKGYYYDRKEGSCLLCGEAGSRENLWFDKYGLKCVKCQKAVDTKIIPVSVIKNKESWYSKDELNKYFNITSPELRKYIKQELLIERVIFGEGKKVHLQLFLINDNKNILPPKKILKSKMGKVIKNGEEYYTLQQWYEFIDHKSLKRLMKYKIMECLKETFAKPIERGSFIAKVKGGINPLFMV